MVVRVDIPILFPVLGRKHYLFPKSMMLIIGFMQTFFIKLKRFPSVFFFFFFYYFCHEWMCWILSNAFSASIDLIIWFFFFSLLISWRTLINFLILNQPCIPGITPLDHGIYLHFLYCWFLFANVLLRIFTSIFMRGIGLQFYFCTVFVWI